jgi:methylisocitrate lyase
MLGEMQHRTELYELLDYASYQEYDANIFNFDIPH